MNKHWKYLVYIIRHKWFVGYACWKKGLYLQAFTHDLSKFRPDEWIPYANHFYGFKPKPDSKGYIKSSDNEDVKFNYATELHYRRNAHHWQWWEHPAIPEAYEPAPMTELALIEMLCDWWGASMAQGYKGKSKTWYEKNKDKMHLHPDTRKWIEENVSDDFLRR